MEVDLDKVRDAQINGRQHEAFLSLLLVSATNYDAPTVGWLWHYLKSKIILGEILNNRPFLRDPFNITISEISSPMTCHYSEIFTSLSAVPFLYDIKGM